MMNRTDVRTQFDDSAASYDQQRQKLIPCFEDFYSIPMSLMNTNKTSPSFLDIGAGTGLLSARILKAFPDAQITLIDLSAKMLDVARKRFSGNSAITFIESDYTNETFGKPFDFVVSSLSIHHLNHTDKQTLFKRIYQTLNHGGRFINADQVLGATPEIDKFYKTNWIEEISASGLSESEIAAAIERTELDQMAPLNDQLNWLSEAGFSNVNCYYKHFNFTIVAGEK